MAAAVQVDETNPEVVTNAHRHTLYVSYGTFAGGIVALHSRVAG